MFSTVLVPLDFSALGESSIPYARVIGGATGAPLKLLTVVESEATGLFGVPDAAAAGLQRQRRQVLEQYLAVTAERLRGQGLVVTSVLAEGDPVVEIVAEAGRDEGSVIVMATHGRGGMGRWLLGSVADKVMRLATCPTLLVRPPEAVAGAEIEVGSCANAPVPPIRRLMAPLDGSVLAEEALAPAAALALALGAVLTLVQVAPWVAATITPYGYVPDLAGWEAEAASAAEVYLEDVQRRLPRGVRAERIVLRGAPAEVLVDLALHDQVDLVVMTTHGRGGLRRLTLGSVADRMVRGGAPTLLVRAAPVAGSGVPSADRAKHDQRPAALPAACSDDR